MFQRRSIQLATLAALAFCLAACGEETTAPAENGETITDYVASVSFTDTDSTITVDTMQTEDLPRPTADGPAIAIEGHTTVVNGGTATLTVTSPTPFDAVQVAGSAPISRLFMPVSGFFAVPLPTPTTSADLLLTFPQSLPSGDFELFFSASAPGGLPGSIAKVSFAALTVGSGDVQVTVTWDTDADVDLHVVDPAGQEIFWANRQSQSGGELDLDSNAACNTDGVRNENITWAEGTAPQGTYTVRVDYWSSCGASTTNYTVLVHNEGISAIYRGSFTGSGDNGGPGSGVLIDTFTRASGPAAAPIRNPVPDLPAHPTTKFHAPTR